MTDRYGLWADLVAHHREGEDYLVHLEPRGSWLVIAPHGGGIEPGTTEIAQAIAGHDLSYYSLEGTMPSENSMLHITSTNFDEPKFLLAAEQHDEIIAIHGSDDSKRGTDILVWVGGSDAELAQQLCNELSAANFSAKIDPRTPGRMNENACNRGRLGKGIQLELAEALRARFFKGLNRSGRRVEMPLLAKFAKVVRTVLKSSLPNNLSKQSERDILIQFAEKLIGAQRIDPFSSHHWFKTVPASPGVYALWERQSGCAIYVGETADLRARMKDLGHYQNHICRRKLAAKFRLNASDEAALSAAIGRTHSLSYLEVSFGRTELEEYLAVRWSDRLLNSPGRRHLDRYSWVKKERCSGSSPVSV